MLSAKCKFRECFLVQVQISKKVFHSRWQVQVWKMKMLSAQVQVWKRFPVQVHVKTTPKGDLRRTIRKQRSFKPTWKLRHGWRMFSVWVKVWKMFSVCVKVWKRFSAWVKVWKMFSVWVKMSECLENVFCSCERFKNVFCLSECGKCFLLCERFKNVFCLSQSFENVSCPCQT